MIQELSQQTVQTVMPVLYDMFNMEQEQNSLNLQHLSVGQSKDGSKDWSNKDEKDWDGKMPQGKDGKFKGKNYGCKGKRDYSAECLN